MRRLERNSGANQFMALAECIDFGDEEYMFLEGEFLQFETSVGPVTGYGNSPAFSFFRPVIPEGMVLDTTVIPQDNIVFFANEIVSGNSIARSGPGEDQAPRGFHLLKVPGFWW